MSGRNFWRGTGVSGEGQELLENGRSFWRGTGASGEWQEFLESDRSFWKVTGAGVVQMKSSLGLAEPCETVVM